MSLHEIRFNPHKMRFNPHEMVYTKWDLTHKNASYITHIMRAKSQNSQNCGQKTGIKSIR